MTTLNQILDVFKAYQELPDSLLNDFGYGPTDNIGNSVQMKFPYLWVTHTQSSTIQLSASGNKTMTPIYRFTLLIVDQLNDSKNIKDLNGQDAHNGQELVSDCWQIAQDIVNFLHTSPSMRALNISLEAEDPNINPLFDETDDKVNGVTLDLAIRTTYGCITAATITGQCYPAIVTNSNESFNASFTSGSTNVLEDIVVTVGGGAVLNKPAAVDISLQDYYYAVNPTGTRVPQTIPIQNGNTQVPWLSSVNVTTGLGSITKTSGGVDWNAQGIFIISTLGDFEVEWKVTSGTIVMAGLNYVDAFADFADLDFAFYNTTNGNYDIRENGASRGGVGLINVNDVLSIKRQGFQILYKINGTTVYVSNVIASSNALSRGYMLFDNSILTQGGGLTNVKLTYL